jgi:hypothetical protein
MTHEEVVNKVTAEFFIQGIAAKEELEQVHSIVDTALTTYRAQVEMEERGNIRWSILQTADKQDDEKIKAVLKKVVLGIDLISAEAVMKHPTN